MRGRFSKLCLLKGHKKAADYLNAVLLSRLYSSPGSMYGDNGGLLLKEIIKSFKVMTIIFETNL